MTPSQQKAWAALALGPAYQPRQSVALADQPIFQEKGGKTIAALNWEELRSEVSACQRCALGGTLRNPVFGVGVESPEWLVIGEAPGEQEDSSGEPFVGEAGLLLDAMLASVGASRTKNVFVLNVLKCRPPGNRDPQPEEVASCRPFLMRQLALLNPALILTVGKFAAQTLLEVDDKIGALRGRVHQVLVGDRPIPLVASYHPAYFLRRPDEKVKGWHDLCLAKSVAPASSK